MTRIFFATDLHGSEKCWLKLLRASKVYSADTVILGGDITGKAVLPFVRQKNGTYTCEYMGEQLTENWKNYLCESGQRLRRRYALRLPNRSGEERNQALSTNNRLEIGEVMKAAAMTGIPTVLCLKVVL